MGQVAAMLAAILRFSGMSGDSDLLPDLGHFEQGVQAPSLQLIVVQETERRRVARELHDDFAQRLVVLSRELRALGSKQPVSAALRAEFDALAEAASGIAIDLDRMARNLHPIILQDLGLAAALRSECERFSDRYAIPVQCHIAESAHEIPSMVALSLFRVAQECFSNIAKHAKAQSVQLRLEAAEDRLLLSVRDTGTGFPAGQPSGEGRLGLISMRERMRLVNGKLAIESEPGKGVTVTAIAPLSPPSVSDVATEQVISE